jgi:hypothetical protein
MNAAGEGDQLFLRPRNCGFFAGEVVIERGDERVGLRVSSSILPTWKRAALGLGVGGLAALYPIWILGMVLLMAVVIAAPLLLHPYTFFGAVAALLITGFVVVGPFMPFLLASAWGFFLRSGRAWVRSVIGVGLGAIVALLMYVLVHSHLGVPTPTRARLLVEVFIISLAWLGTAMIYLAGFRTLLPAAATVTIGTIMVVLTLENYAMATFEKPAKQTSGWIRMGARSSDVVAPGTFELLDGAKSGVEAVGKIARASVCVQLVVTVSYILLMMFMVPIPVPKQPSC